MLITAVLLILAGLVVTFTGIIVGSRLSRRVRATDRESVRGASGGLVCGLVVLAGAVTILLGIADGLFLVLTGD